MRDTKAVVSYLKSLDFYKEFVTYTQLKNAELGIKAQETSAKVNEQNGGSVGRPRIADEDIENDNTAADRDKGTDTKEGREK